MLDVLRVQVVLNCSRQERCFFLKLSKQHRLIGFGLLVIHQCQQVRCFLDQHLGCLDCKSLKCLVLDRSVLDCCCHQNQNLPKRNQCCSNHFRRGVPSYYFPKSSCPCPRDNHKDHTYLPKVGGNSRKDSYPKGAFPSSVPKDYTHRSSCPKNYTPSPFPN